MYEHKIPEDMECGITIAHKILGGKWKACIIDCLSRGVKRPSELHRQIAGAPVRVINIQLRELEDHQVICKKVYPGFPLKVEYFLTDLGRSILPVVRAMDNWGHEHREEMARITNGLPVASV